MSQAITVYTVATPLVPAGPFNWVHLHNASAIVVYLSYDGTPITLATGVPLAAGARLRLENGNKPHLFVKGISGITASGSASMIVAYSAAFIVPAVEAPEIPLDPLSTDDLETYLSNTSLEGYNDGANWAAAYVGRTAYYLVQDDLENYIDAADLDTLNSGSEWFAAFVSRSNYFMVQDDLETYTDTADLGGLNDGTNWNAAFVSR